MTPIPMHALKITIYNTNHTNNTQTHFHKYIIFFRTVRTFQQYFYWTSNFHNSYFIYFVYFIYYIYLFIYIFIYWIIYWFIYVVGRLGGRVPARCLPTRRGGMLGGMCTGSSTLNWRTAVFKRHRVKRWRIDAFCAGASAPTRRSPGAHSFKAP